MRRQLKYRFEKLSYFLLLTYDSLTVHEIVLWTAGLAPYDGHTHCPYHLYSSEMALIGSHFTSGHAPCPFGHIQSHLDKDFFETVGKTWKNQLRKM